MSMSIEEAVRVLNERKHQGCVFWRPFAGCVRTISPVWGEGMISIGSSEAIAIAEKYQREDAS